MIRWLISLIAFGFCTAHALAGNSPGNVLLEFWDVAYLGDQQGRAGYVHTIAREVVKEGKKLIRTTVEVRLTVKRLGDVLQISMDTGSIETAEGKVIGVFMKQGLGKKQLLHIEGTVSQDGKQLKLTLNGDKPLLPAPWNEAVVGLYRQQTIAKDRQIKPGTQFTYLSFEPTINLVVKTEVIAREFQQVELKGTRKKQQLLLVETIPEKVEYQRTAGKTEYLQIPITRSWLDDNGRPVKSETEVPALGRIVLYRTTRAEALTPGPIAQLTDVGISHIVRLKNRIPHPYETTSAVYRITIKNDNANKEEIASSFSQDDRQQVKNVQGNTFELHVKASSRASTQAGEKEAAAEFLQSSYFINSNSAKVKELARRAVGSETDPLRKALRIEKWVHTNMKFRNHENFATADEVAQTLEGDCSEYSMLAAAMCRAEGVPSRTAMGLMYGEFKGVPNFGFHMWTEVWIKSLKANDMNRGRWIPIDAIVGKGYVGATHLKITDHSWAEERTLTPIYPVIRVAGRLNIEVMRTESR